MAGSSLHSGDIHVSGYHKLLMYVGKYDGKERTMKIREKGRMEER
jgi:hypothetical protein